MRRAAEGDEGGREQQLCHDVDRGSHRRDASFTTTGDGDHEDDGEDKDEHEEV